MVKVARRLGRVLYPAAAAVAILALLAFVVPGLWPPPEPAMRTGVDVVRVVDGDTIVVRLDGTEQSVRLIGIDTPETTKGKNECAGKEATTSLRMLIGGEPVLLIADDTQADRDRYDRLLRYVEVDGQDAGLSLIEHGLAREYTYRESDPYVRQDRYRAAHDRARADNEGGWYVCGW